MKWAIISTKGKNPGDEFIREGVLKVIQSVDSNAQFAVIDKELPEIHNPIEYDKIILAGMPVFWSFKNNHSWNVPWWKVITEGWVAQRPRDFCILGAGSFQDQTDFMRGVDSNRLKKETRKLIDRSYLITARDPIVSKTTGFDFDTNVCPAILSLYDENAPRMYRACNLMPHGAHYAPFNENEARIWNGKALALSDIFKHAGFSFIAHNNMEYKYATESLGWHSDHVIRYQESTRADGYFPLLTTYNKVDKFFGNRVHGCILSRGAGADVISCGYDSRQEAVKLSGARTILPSEIDLAQIEKWAYSENSSNITNTEEIFTWYRDIISDFAEL